MTESNEPRKTPGQRRAERVIFLLSLALVLGTLIALVLADRFWEPDLANVAPHVTATRVLAASDETIVHYEVENKGQLSIAEVVVEVSAGEGGAKVEAVFAHLPRGAKRAGVAVLKGPPTRTRPQVRVLGYQLP